MKAEKETEDLYYLMESILDDNEINEFLKYGADEIWKNHFGIGLWLRNNVLTGNNSIYRNFIRRGLTDKDEMSAILTEGFYWYLKSKEIQDIKKNDRVK
ncbi:MAG: hypothetical protein J6B25_02860 [Clostridia bacterium]|nr:hypothetical protein [Clostridia bacterium]